MSMAHHTTHMLCIFIIHSEIIASLNSFKLELVFFNRKIHCCTLSLMKALFTTLMYIYINIYYINYISYLIFGTHKNSYL